jgi:hypothetical protein
MDLTKQTEDLIVNGLEDFFESSESRMDLHVAIRIANDFHRFLLDFGETPPLDEVTYMMDTIRSGMDQFFSLAYSCRVVSDGAAKWNFDRQLVSSFSELRRACLHRFEELHRPEASATELLASLLALVHLELTFLAQNFPSIVLNTY